MNWLQLILIATAAAVGWAVDCDWLKSPNPTCVKSMICDDKNGNNIYVYEDCSKDSVLLTATDAASLFPAEDCDFFYVSEDTLKLEVGIDAEGIGDLTSCFFTADKVPTFINILDVNEFSPEPVDGSTESDVEVDEGIADPNFVKFDYEDGDHTEGESLTAVFADEISAGDFTIAKEVKGNVTTFKIGTQPLDYESRMSYFIKIIIISTDERGTTRNTTHIVVLNVNDVGDNPPTWTKIVYSEEFPEGEAGRYVFDVKAQDGDLGVNNPIQYSIIDGNDDGFFEIDQNSGDVNSLKFIDREQLAETTFSLVIMAQEFTNGSVAPEPNNSTTTTNVYIKDINDNAPVFNEDVYKTNMPELNAANFLLNVTMFVFDMDELDSGEFTITSDCDDIRIQPITSRLNSSLSLTALWRDDTVFDYEKHQDPITILLTATETQNTSHIGTATLQVTLTDVNDISPVFGQDSYEASVEETEPEGFPVTTVTALDADASDDYGTASIRYTLVRCEELNVDNMTGAITLAQDDSLDYETSKTLTCQIEAHDNKDVTPMRIGKSQILIQVIDVVDSPPTMSTMPSGVKVAENEETGFQLDATINGEDKDADADIHFEINWSQSSAEFEDKSVAIEEVKGWFTIEKTDGGVGEASKYSAVVKVGDTKPDREVADQVTLSIEIIDVNTTVNMDKDSGSLEITIIDKNDCDPEFNNPQDTFDLKENAIGSTPIATFSAYDLDLNDSVTFDISDDSLVHLVPDGSDPFVVVLQVVDGADIDREVMATIDVTVSVTDLNNHTTDLSVTINIIDLNDNRPKMDINFCNKTLNLAEVEGLAFNDESATENGTSVWNFTAADADAGAEHSRVVYGLDNDGLQDQKNRRLPFKIDETTGHLSVFLDPSKQKNLDREVDSFWELYVTAYDHCNEGEFECKSLQSGLCSLYINVTDVNDNRPGDFIYKPIIVNEFLKKGQIAEPPVGEPYEIIASDADETGNPNTILTYTVLSVNLKGDTEDKALFEAVNLERPGEADKTQYYCRLKATKDFTSLRGDYEIHLMAEDAGTPPLNNNVTIDLTIEDANDHTPTFNFLGCLGKTNQTITMIENTGGTIKQCLINTMNSGDETHIVVVDDDLGLNADYDVKIDRGNTTGGNQTSDFDIKYDGVTSTFQIYATKPIDREQGNMYHLSLYVQDKGNPPLESWSWVQIIVTNDFEYRPYFCDDDPPLCYQTIYIKENDTEATGVFMKATDQDNKDVDPSDPSDYDPVFYDFSGGDKTVFALSATHNDTTLQLTKALDREEIQNYSLYIDTYNRGGAADPTPYPKPRNFTLYLTIIVQDINDEEPDFGKTVIGSFTENDQKGNIVATVKANDNDLNETLVYALGDSFEWIGGGTEDPVPFKIVQADNNTANLLLNFDPTGVNTGYCIFNITCTDNNEMHTGITEAKVFAITVDFLVPVYFANTEPDVRTQKENIEIIFGEAFGYDCSVDSIDGGTVQKTSNAADAAVTVRMHFINNKIDAPVPKEDILQAANEETVINQLYNRLDAIHLNLNSLGDNNHNGNDGTGTVLMLQILLAVVGFVLLSLVILLMIAYFIRTRSLERQVKVLSTNTFGSRASNLNRVGTEMAAIPGSNKFPGEGSNPLYNLPDEDIRNDDGDSSDSGDSVLVGVEENPEFRNHGESKNDFGGGYDNAGFGRSIDAISAPDPFSGGTRTNPLLEMGNGSGEDVDLSDGLKNYEMILHRGSSGSEDDPGSSPYENSFSF